MEVKLKIGEQWDCHLPDLGQAIVSNQHQTITLINLLRSRERDEEHDDDLLKLGLKKMTIKKKISGDFLVQECDVDYCAASKMKTIMVRHLSRLARASLWLSAYSGCNLWTSIFYQKKNTFHVKFLG